ncbi:MAG TPA: T9SS type A sorting domain-containing protein [Bacteroidia bacterium]|jgi:hypothetical protein|nr:T9SS type A sorting domain-containing protein [Bacteroidia bacterium]
MKKTLLICLIAVIYVGNLHAQCTDCYKGGHLSKRHYTKAQAHASINGGLSQSYLAQNVCGLNYTQETVFTAKRYNPVSGPAPTGFPVNLNITGLPSLTCASIVKAYLYYGCTYTEASPPSTSATVTNPALGTSTVSSVMVGTTADNICWPGPGSATYRTDVTSLISGNGTYRVGLNGFASADSEVDGITLLIIYSDPSASYSGSIVLYDGDMSNDIGTPESYTAKGFNVCGVTANANAFTLLADVQNNVNSGVNTENYNGDSATFSNNFWNYNAIPVNLTSGQDSVVYNTYTNNTSDCYFISLVGLYWQNTNCVTCVPAVTTMTLTTSSIAATCGSNGSASVGVTGAAGPLTYSWSPSGQTTDTAKSLSAGTYTVSVSDGSTCVTDTVTITNSGMTVNLFYTNATCSTPGSAILNVTGGTPPYTYMWSNGATTSSVSLSAGTYYASVTNGVGCTITDSVTINNYSSLYSIAYSSPVICLPNSGSAWATIYYGTPPFTYSWSPGGQTTDSISGLSAGSYSVTVTDSNGCSMMDSVAVYSDTVSYYAYGSPTVIVPGDSTLLSAYCNVSATYSWAPASSVTYPDSANSYAKPTVNTTYTVTITTACGVFTDTVTISMGCINPYDESICIVTVDTATDRNEIIWGRLNSPPSGSYNVYSENSSYSFSLIDNQPLSSLSEYIDTASRPWLGSNTYALATVDSCGVSAMSSPHTTIFLTDSSSANLNVLNWTAYVGFTPTEYLIYRGPALNALTLIDSVSSTTLTYKDTLPPSACLYLIAAVSPSGLCIPTTKVKPHSGQHGTVSLSNSRVANNPTGIQTLTNSFTGVNIYPNPGNGLITLSYSLETSGSVCISVIDELGQIVYDMNEQRGAGKVNEQLNLESLAAGIYSLRMQTSSGIAIRKLMIIRNR